MLPCFGLILDTLLVFKGKIKTCCPGFGAIKYLSFSKDELFGRWALVSAAAVTLRVRSPKFVSSTARNSGMSSRWAALRGLAYSLSS